MRPNEPRCVFTGLRLLHAQEFEGWAPEIDQRPPTNQPSSRSQSVPLGSCQLWQEGNFNPLNLLRDGDSSSRCEVRWSLRKHTGKQECDLIFSYSCSEQDEFTLDEQTSRFRLAPVGASFPPGLDFPFSLWMKWIRHRGNGKYIFLSLQVRVKRKSSRGRQKMMHGGEDSKNLTAIEQRIKQPGGSSARASLFWAEFLWLLLFETVARVLQRSQVNNKRLGGGGKEKAANQDPVSLRKFFHVCPTSPKLPRGVTVETHSHLYLMKSYGSCRPVTHVVPLVTGHALCSETTNGIDVTRQQTDKTSADYWTFSTEFVEFAANSACLLTVVPFLIALASLFLFTVLLKSKGNTDQRLLGWFLLKNKNKTLFIPQINLLQR